MKKIDWLVLRSFVPPFMIWFFVALFVFNMQFLWKYIDDIIGKGLELSIIFELLFYQALAMIPHALIFGMALASVMTVGNLAEHYELAAMKSAGVNLLRIMRPLIFVGLAITLGSFSVANYAIPFASLKFKARLFDIRKQKPALALKAGAFNNDFKDYSIYIGKKDTNNRNLEDVRIYDHTRQMGNVSQTNAEKGELYFSEDKRYLIIKLINGERQEERAPAPQKPYSYPYWRIGFKSYISMFDMGQFDTKRTDEDAFGNHASLLSVGQLINAADSLHKRAIRRVREMQRSTDAFFHARRDILPMETDTSNKGTVTTQLPILTQEESEKIAQAGYTPKNIFPPASATSQKRFDEGINPADRYLAFQRASSSARHILTQANNMRKVLENQEGNHAEYEHEIHKKFVFALACMVFLFIGAPMGAIIRKGGFGIPVLVAFIGFMVFFVLNLVGDRLSKDLILPCWLASWMSLIVLAPIAALLTYQSMQDTNQMSWWEWIKKRIPFIAKG